ncbi:MAG: TonB-dependent receptor plug domain-containing protein [Bacteroidia bacterium]|jgi:TonB-dependent SusC/RagA subfamily outer membrane receptor|nr:TonB-dependent receptor plug domain-containing protein [Bacteroidia bacterium]
MKAINYLVAGFLFLAVVYAVPSYGQKNSKRNIITGYVVDVNQYPVNNAIIMIDKNSTSVVTDERGFYKVRVKPYATSISIISLTHGMLEEAINGRTRINFTFPIAILSHNNIPDYKPEEEEINVGYGTVKRKNLTTPVGKIYGNNRQYASFNSIYDMLQGSVPGVMVNRGQVLIRGITSNILSNEPLFVVDGTPVSTISDISPQMVESIEVLKGPSSAIYGSRGANGAILVDLIGAPPYRDSLTLNASGKVPFAETRAATNIKGSTATLNGVVNAKDLPTSVTFEYGTTPGHGTTIASAQSPVTGNLSACVSADITGLKAGITYYFRVVAANSLGKTTGINIPFKYSGEVPVAKTNAATNSSPRTAQLNGIVNARGLSTVVTFEYGTTTSYGTVITAAQSPVTGLTSARVSANVTDLKAGTNYHCRIVTTNDIGTNYGEDVTFKSEYVIGEYLYGGYVFYVDETGEHGLVCAPSDQSLNALWSHSAPAGAAGRAIGTGYQNTADIIIGCPEEGIAARLCYDLEMDGYSDWFLPSIDELLLMYTNLHSKGLSSFKDHFYWSSTQDKYGAWVVSFYYGSKSNHNRNENAIRTRAVRAF